MGQRQSVWALTLLLACLAAAGATCGAQGADALPKVEHDTSDLLSAGDEIEILVFGEAELSGKQKIRPTGAVRLPLIGNVVAAGLTPDELALRIQTSYNERYLKNAEVTINVLSSTANNVYVLGSVQRPGPYPMNGKMTLIDALARAGGTTKLGDEGRVQLTRKYNTSEQMLVVVDAADVRRGSAVDVELVPGDVVFVPESPL